MNDAVTGVGCVVPAFDFNALAFEIFVDGEEVGDFLNEVRVDVGVVPDVGVARVVFAHGDDFLVEDTLVEHLEETDGANLLHAAGKTWTGNQNQNIQRIAILTQRGRNKAVIAGVMNRRVQIAVEFEDVQFFVVLEFVGVVLGDLNDGTEASGERSPMGSSR